MVLENEIISSRSFPYSREVLFDAYTNPMLLKLWWGPNGFTNTIHEFNLVPSGNWIFTMHGPDGKNYENQITFVRIEHPKKIISNHISPPIFQLEISFSEFAGLTTVTFKMIFETEEICNTLKGIIVPANEENFDRLEKVLNTK
jgi:uncharacterized protein YndB with AHSA1/START domain